MVPLLLGLALAEVPRGGETPAHGERRFQLGIGQGVEAVINDPFVQRTGFRQGFHFAPSPWVELGGAVTWFPVIDNGGDDPSLTPLGEQAVREGFVTPVVSWIKVEGQLTAAVLPFRARLGAWEARLGFLAGAALVRTEDDLAVLYLEDDPEAQASETQVHPASVFGVEGDVRTKWFGVRLRTEHLRHIEVLDSTGLFTRGFSLVGLELITWFP